VIILLDASAVVKLVIEPTTTTRALGGRLRSDPDAQAPHLVDAEVANALRRKLLSGELDLARAVRAIRRLKLMASFAGSRPSCWIAPWPSVTS
jgi:predicted nucleic acid-binding protein